MRKKIQVRSNRSQPIITLLTDFGYQDSYVGEMKGVILDHYLNRRPQPTLPCLVDITHSIPPGDIIQGARLLGHVYRCFPPGTIHLAVVDPGVGGKRKPIVIAAHKHWFVGPDNGLFSEPAMTDKRFKAYEIQSTWTREISPTFHGRDIFAPAAAELASGQPILRWGKEIKSITLFKENMARALPGNKGWVGHIVALDHFGNAATNLNFSILNTQAHPCVKVGGVRITRFVKTFSEAPPGEAAVLINSYGELEIILANGSAAQKLHLKPKQEIFLHSISRIT